MLLMGNLSFPDWLNDEVINRRGWTFGELGRRAGISSGQISKVMTHSLMPSWEFCFRVSQALQIPPTEVFREAGLLPIIPEHRRREFEEVAAMLAGLPDGARRTIPPHIAHIRYKGPRPA